MFPLTVGRYIFRALKEGAKGWDVYALQCGLGITADGDFGPATAKATREFQSEHELIVDEIAGLATQRAVLQERIWPQQAAFKTPAGLARGMVEGECGWQIGNYTKAYSNGTRDVGCTMRNGQPVDNFLRAAFDPRPSIERLCRRLRSGDPGWPYGHDNLFGKPGAKTHRRAWELATLAWNWPAAAETLAKGGALSTAPAQWVIDIGVAGVDSPAEWAAHYIATKTVYVKEWIA